MQYMLLIYEDENAYGDEHDSPAVMEILQMLDLVAFFGDAVLVHD